MLADRFLETYATESLKVMARRRGLRDAGSASKAVLIDYLSPRLFSREANRRLVEALPPGQRRLLAALKARGGRSNTLALSAAVASDAAQARSDLNELLELGLLLYPAEGGPLKYRLGECERVWMDRSAAAAVDPAAATGATPKLLAHPPARIRDEQLGLLLADLLLLLVGMERGRFEPPPATAARPDESGPWIDLAPRLLIAPDIDDASNGPHRPAAGATGRPRLLYLLAEEAGLLKVKNGRLTAGEAATRFFHQPRSTQAATLFRIFTRLQTWNEFTRIEEIVSRPLPDRIGKTHAPSPGRVARARARVLTALRRFDPERWYAFSALRREIKASHPQFLIRRGGAATAGHQYLGLGERGRGQTTRGLDLTADWDRVEGRFIARVLLEPLLWFGAVSLGFDETPEDEPSHLDAFRITREGAYLLGVSDALPGRRPAGRELVVQPDFDLLCLSPDPDTCLLHDLSRFAEFTGGDRVVRFTLTRPAAMRGFHDGWDVARITTRLDDAAAVPMPQNVAATMASWEEAYHRFRIVRRVTLVEDRSGTLTMDAGVLTGVSGARRLQPDLWRVPAGSGRRLARRLRDENRTVRCIDYATAPGHGLILGPMLRITRNERGTDWITEGLLRRCATPLGEDGTTWVLDRDVVAATCRDGLDASELLAMLEARSATVSPEIRVALAAWGQTGAEVSVGQVQLFVCRDADLLGRILDTPSLAQCLGEALGAGVFAVARGQVTRLRERLQAIGLRFTPGLRLPAENRPAGDESAGTANRHPSRVLRKGRRIEPGTGASTAPGAWSRPSDRLEGRDTSVSLHDLLRRAIVDRRAVRMIYRANGLVPGPREVFPLRLSGQDLVAYCRQRSVQRTYRLDRIISLEVLPGRGGG
ncbi:MAG: WYL domain-containing protein [Acidobacteriota bacterium]